MEVLDEPLAKRGRAPAIVKTEIVQVANRFGGVEKRRAVEIGERGEVGGEVRGSKEGLWRGGRR